MKMNETCNVYALAKSDGKFYYAAKEIKVTLGRLRRLSEKKMMANAIKVRSKIEGDVALIRLLISHPMETGLRKDAEGQLVPCTSLSSSRSPIRIAQCCLAAGTCGNCVICISRSVLRRAKGRDAAHHMGG